MLHVLFFGRVREELDCASMDVALEPRVSDLDGLQRYLCERGGSKWAETLGQANIIRAVNQKVVDGNPALAAGDEVAFFPPVTGG